MLKTVMLVSALAISAPAFAQDTPVQSNPQSTTAPAETMTPAAPAATPAQEAPVSDPAQTAATTPAAPATDATATPGKPVTGATQIAQVVETEFPTYDKNADTNLDKAEFGAWMVALKSASDPSTKATDPATKTWVNGAFASADTDKSKSVSKDELTKYLSQGQG